MIFELIGRKKSKQNRQLNTISFSEINLIMTFELTTRCCDIIVHLFNCPYNSKTFVSYK